MSDNKFIKHLRGEDTTKSVLEVKNQRTTTSFANMPDGNTSNANDVYSDHRGNATGVLKGTENWKLDGQNLVETTTVYGDGRDFTNSFSVFSNGLWVDATYTFATARRFSPNTKFVLKLCGHDLETVINHTVDFTLIVKFGVSNLISKTFTVTEQAFDFCKEFVIDFAESNSSTIKVDAGSTMQVQLLCSDPAAQAVLYNGMTVFTALQRRVDGEVVASDTKTFPEIEQDITDLQEDLEDLEEYVDDTFVRLDGTSIMTAPLKFTSGSMRGAVGPYLNGVSFWKMDTQGTIINYANFTDSRLWPVTTNAIDLGRSANKWKDLYLAGKAYMSVINNGYDIAIPVTNSPDTFALKSEVDLAANSGRMITDQGVWYAKMYAATVAPSAEDGTNYADFSQTDGQGNPIIVIYERQNGAWVQSETITPPAEYDGYVSITSKIWDITEQAGQQGGRILWNHQSKEFTPYPQIISFEDIQITGNSTVVMPQTPSANQIVNKDYVDNAIGNGTITLTQGGTPMGSFTTNQSNDTTIALDGGSYHPDLFDVKWADHQLNDASWLRADTFSWQSGAVYQAAYQHLVDDMSGKTPADALSEVVGSYTIYYYLADDGHKICTPDQESVVQNIYNATGVAWYYIIDTENQRFKLPRTKFGFTGIRNSVGKFVSAGLPNINVAGSQPNVVVQSGAGWGSGALNTTGDTDIAYTGGGSAHTWLRARTLNLAISYSNSVYGNSDTVQPKATEMYLYFYMGPFTQTALENTAGINTELFNGKVDIGHQVIEFQAPTADNNYTWYRKYADGWVEQGGQKTGSSSTYVTVNLPITMANTGYFVAGHPLEGANNSAASVVAKPLNTRTTSQVQFIACYQGTFWNGVFVWEVKGVAA